MTMRVPVERTLELDELKMIELNAILKLADFNL